MKKHLTLLPLLVAFAISGPAKAGGNAGHRFGSHTADRAKHYRYYHRPHYGYQRHWRNPGKHYRRDGDYFSLRYFHDNWPRYHKKQRGYGRHHWRGHHDNKRKYRRHHSKRRY